MVHKPIAIMILPVFVAGILMLGILAATGNAQESSNNGNRQNTLPETEENNAHFAQESNNHPMCLNEHTEKWEPCVVKNSPQKHESSNTPSSQESSNNGKVAQESSNNGKGANNTGQSSVPVRPAITLTPIQAHVTTKAHMTTSTQQLSNNGTFPKLTLAPKPTGPAVAPRLIGAKTIAEVQQLKKERERAELQRITEYMQQTQKIIREGKQVQFDPKKEICQGPQNIAQAPEKYFCLGKVIPKTFTEKQMKCLALARSVSSKGPASHSSLRAFTAMECLPSP
jgi:hypothetical protein